ncbi:Crp/Fnr family transcriptional regulator [Listeria seeligeri]|uniref:Crp/Fnr family transcriptional regulator n=2 Tax=Listeria seeligeri TaxID=1640 RepID=UPI001E5F1B9E|nr:Crp/Fnr family transcriptional regulator [Listeria seeligeri]
MDFMEFHQFVKQDLLIYSWVTKNFHLNKKELMKRHQITLDSTHMLIIESGLVLQERMTTRYNGCRIIGGQAIIYTTQGSLCIYGLEHTTYSLLPVEKVFAKMEEQKLLSNFFLQVAEDLEEDLEWEIKLNSGNAKERVDMVLRMLIEKYQLNYQTNPEFPRWLKIYVLAKLAKCSVSTASMIMNEQKKNRVLDRKSTPWFLLEHYQTLYN